jgi:23S rRNA (cytosine1962-C5)-methyltransferase
MQYPLVILHPGREQSLLRRHQWIFSKAIKQKDTHIRDGDIISVADSNGNVLATGHYQDSSLSIRILEFAQETIDSRFWTRKLQSAFDYRRALGLTGNAETNAYRLIHGEGDELPGLIIDIYDHVAVIQAHSIGMYRQRQEIADVLKELTQSELHGVYDKSIAEMSKGTPEQNRWLVGSAPDDIRISENGIAFVVDVVRGQKTGFFLDQRVNRQFIRDYASGKDVLNCFCYTGGFSLYALAGNARRVTSVDSSGIAIEMLEQNIQNCTFNGEHHTVAADVMQFLGQTNDNFDIVICDPPAFAKSLHKRHNAVQAYKRLNVMAMKRVKPGGMLFTFSCSQVVDRQLFYDTIVAAAIEVSRPVRVMFEMSQGPDHPVSIFHPEGSYLKGLALYFEN